MTRSAFIQKIIDEITEGGSIPISPKKDRINNIINNSAAWFWQNDDDSHQFEYIVVSKEALKTPLFKEKRIIKMPDCVHAIAGVTEMGFIHGYQFSEISPDFRKTAFNYHLALSGDSDTMLYGVIASYYADFMRNFVVRTVSFDFNNYTHLLTITGRDKVTDLICEAYVNISEEALFENNRFFRYVAGYCRKSIGSVLSIADMKLLGGYGLSGKDIKSDGKDEMEKVEKEIIDQRNNTVDFFEEF